MRVFSSIAAVLCLLGCGKNFVPEPTGTAGSGGHDAVGSPGGGGSSGGTAPTGGGGGSAAGASGTGGVTGGTGGTGGVTGGTGGVAGGSGSGGGGSPESGLGGPCDGNDDCASDMHCITSGSTELLGGGAPRGYCTKACSSDASICSALDPRGICGPFDVAPEPRWCLLSCTAGASAFKFSDDVCLGRRDVACSPLGDGWGEPVTACRPLCGSDADCDGGRYCDMGTGACVDGKPTGKRLGKPCNPQELPDPCAGLCLESFCAGYCVMGTEGMPGACGSPVDGVQTGACLYNLETNNNFTSEGYGDMAVCAPLCDCTGDCAFPDDICVALGGNLGSTLGRPGYCTSRPHAGELTSCD